MTQKQSQQTIPCPECNSIMAATQTEGGVFYVCGHCGHRVPANAPETLEE